jgi:hypothetical protein
MSGLAVKGIGRAQAGWRRPQRVQSLLAGTAILQRLASAAPPPEVVHLALFPSFSPPQPDARVYAILKHAHPLRRCGSASQALPACERVAGPNVPPTPRQTALRSNPRRFNSEDADGVDPRM